MTSPCLEREDDFGAIDVIEAVLIESGGPILIAPSRPPANLLDRGAIAWKTHPKRRARSLPRCR